MYQALYTTLTKTVSVRNHGLKGEKLIEQVIQTLYDECRFKETGMLGEPRWGI